MTRSFTVPVLLAMPEQGKCNVTERPTSAPAVPSAPASPPGLCQHCESFQGAELLPAAPPPRRRSGLGERSERPCSCMSNERALLCSASGFPRYEHAPTLPWWRTGMWVSWSGSSQCSTAHKSPLQTGTSFTG